MRRLSYVLVSLVMCVVFVPAGAQAADAPLFFTVCPESHKAPDDPIVFPGQPGAAHAHDFAGAFSIDAFSTVDSLRRSGTTCDIAKDTAGYWTPSLYKNGQPVKVVAFFAYYAAGIHEGPIDRSQIKAPPAGLKIVADMKARPQDSFWHCGDGTVVAEGGTGSNTTIPTCDPATHPMGVNAKLQSLVLFPDCWDGQNLDSPDHRSHMAYAGRNAAGARIGCPSTHPVPIASLSLKTRYDTYGGSGFSLSSGDPATMHADFFNAWDQTELERLTKRCINDEFRNGEPCRGDDVGNINPNYPNATPAPAGDPTPTPTPTPTPPPTPTPTPTPAPNAAPTVRLTAPAESSTFSTTLDMAATAGDDKGVTRVEFLVDGKVISTDTTAPYSYGWRVPRKLSYSSHSVVARAYDAAGASASHSATVTRQRAALTLSVAGTTATAAGSTSRARRSIRVWGSVRQRGVRSLRLRVVRKVGGRWRDGRVRRVKVRRGRFDVRFRGLKRGRLRVEATVPRGARATREIRL